MSWRKECTPFQRKVYEAILRIPKGEVRTYAEVARMIGQPNAARAVGQALKRNRWAPRIPCHRVISSKFFVHRTVHGSRRIPRSGIAANGKLGGPAVPAGAGFFRIKALRRRRDFPGLAAWRLPKKLLGGYSGPGGLKRKRELLREESGAAS